MKTGTTILTTAVAMLLIFAACASAQVPAKMSYQVMLTNDSDEPLADQSVTAVFRLYNQEIGGGSLWTETHNAMTNSIGVLSVTLGETVTLGSHLFDEPLWLEVQIDGETLTPRRELVSAPYAQYANDTYMLGNELAEDYVLDSDLAVGGIINTPSNPVDWTKLKGVPAGFADGTDDTGGVGDGHSLDADDGSPVDALYVDADGDVGIGVTAPANKLVVGPDGSGLSYAQFANATTGYNQVDGLRVGVSGTNAFIANNENGSISFLTQAAVRHRIAADGTVEIGGVTTDGIVEVYADGGGSPQIELLASGPTGGHIGLFEDDGEQYLYLEPDYGGTGGFLEVADGDYYAAFEVDGNAHASGGARITMDGPASTTIFEAWQTGDAAVQLPVDAVSSPEMLDEPGVSNTSSTAELALPYGSAETLLSRSIYCPSDGYVLAIGTVEADINHTSGAYSGCYFGLSNTSGGFPAGAGPFNGISSGAGSGLYTETVTSQWIFSASEGVKTIYFLGYETGGEWTVYDRHLSLVFFPTYYAVVAETETEPEPPSDSDLPTAERAVPITESDVAAERAETEAANNARIEAELAAMEAKIAEIRASMGNGR